MSGPSLNLAINALTAYPKQKAPGSALIVSSGGRVVSHFIKSRIVICSLLILGCSLSSQSFAEGKTTWDRLIDPMSVTLFSWYQGPGIGQISNPYQPNEYGVPVTAFPQYFDNALIVLRSLDDNAAWFVGGAFTGGITPILGQGFTLEDPYLKITNKKLIHQGGFNLSVDFRWYLPLSSLTHNSDIVGKVRSTQVTTYDIPGTKFTFVSFTSMYFQTFGSSVDPTAFASQDFVGFAQEGFSYQAWDKLALWTAYEMDTHHNLDTGAFSWNNDGTYLYLGVDWQVTQRFEFQPFLSVRPGGKVCADSTEIEAYISYKFL